MRSRLAAAAFAAALLASAPAWADHGAAVTHFDAGRKLRDERKFDEAAREFEQSLAAEPSIGAFYNLGFVNEQLGKLREAAAAYKRSRSLAHERGDPRAKEAADALSKLLDSSSYIKVEVDEAVVKAAGLQITLDGEVVPRAEYGSEVFRPGRDNHQIVVTAFGRREVKMTLRNRQAFPVVVGEPVFDAGPSPPPPPPAETTSGGLGWQKWAGIGAMGFGVAALTFTAIRGLGYLFDQSSLNDARASANAGCRRKDVPGKGIQAVSCDGPAMQEQARIDAANLASANYDANEQKAKDGLPLTVAAGVVGVVFVGAGIFLFATAPSSAPAASTAGRASPPPRRAQIVPHIGIGDVSLSFSGTL